MQIYWENPVEGFETDVHWEIIDMQFKRLF